MACVNPLHLRQPPALTQIKEKRYFDSLADWHGGLLFVGVNYDEKSKEHSCKIERFVKE